MPMQKSDPGVELAVGTTLVHKGPCGLESIILVGDGTNAASIKLYDVAAVGDIATVIKALALKAESCSAVYCPSKPDSFKLGCVAVVAGTNALGYVSITS